MGPDGSYKRMSILFFCEKYFTTPRALTFQELTMKSLGFFSTIAIMVMSSLVDAHPFVPEPTVEALKARDNLGMPEPTVAAVMARDDPESISPDQLSQVDKDFYTTYYYSFSRYFYSYSRFYTQYQYTQYYSEYYSFYASYYASVSYNVGDYIAHTATYMGNVYTFSYYSYYTDLYTYLDSSTTVWFRYLFNLPSGGRTPSTSQDESQTPTLSTEVTTTSEPTTLNTEVATSEISLESTSSAENLTESIASVSSSTQASIAISTQDTSGANSKSLNIFYVLLSLVFVF